MPKASLLDDSVNSHHRLVLGENTRCDCPECPVASLKLPAIRLPILTGVGVPGALEAATVIDTDMVAVATFAVSVGVNVTVRRWPGPVGRTVPRPITASDTFL